LAISQGSLRRGSAAVYLPIYHPEIEEFIDLRRPTGGDPNRRSLNLHHGVVVTDEFMRAVEKDGDFELRSPYTNMVLEKVKARENGQNFGLTYQGKLDFQPSENVNVTLGTYSVFSKGRGYSFANSLFAPEANSISEALTVRGMGS
jgi:ribonucleotide reductase alpha subunit